MTICRARARITTTMSIWGRWFVARMADASLIALALEWHLQDYPMESSQSTMAEQVAEAARGFQQRRTGYAPAAVTVVLSNDTLVITLHEALTPAERALAQSAVGAAKVQEFHRQLFASSAGFLREEIKRITGVEVREAAAEIETTTGTVIQVFTSGTMVQVFQLAQPISPERWNPVHVAKPEAPP